jgi:polyisoprenoid-binding protein YceI
VIRLASLAAIVLAAMAYPTHAADWKMDAGASRLEFTVTYEKTAAPGLFREFDTRLHLDADKPSENRLDVTIAVKSADMNSADVNKAMGGAEWFDVARYPQAEFHSTDLRKADDGKYLARGTLSLKGVPQSVEVPFTWTETADAARMNGELVVKRGTFGIGTGEWASPAVIGADVKIKFDVHLRKSG